MLFRTTLDKYWCSRSSILSSPFGFSQYCRPRKPIFSNNVLKIIKYLDIVLQTHARSIIFLNKAESLLSKKYRFVLQQVNKFNSTNADYYYTEFIRLN